MAREVNRPVYVLRLRPVPQADPIRSLRAILKVLGWHGLRCLTIVEEASGNPPVLKDPREHGVANIPHSECEDGAE